MKGTHRYILPIAIAALVVGANSLTAFAALDPGLGTAGNFAVLAGSIVTNTGSSWITGQVGVSPSIGVPPHITGFPPGTSGPRHDADGVAGTGHADLVTAFGKLSTPPQPACTTPAPAGDLTGLTLGPGVYCVPAAATNLAGTLTLNGSGVYVFQSPSTLITSSGSRVSLIGGAQPCQVFWQVNSSATIGTTTTFVGNILALTSIAMQTRATLNGRALARNGAVTLDTNRIIQAAGCGYTAPNFVAPPAGNTLPATLAPSSPILGVPSSGGGPPQSEGFPWILALVAGVLVGAGAVRLGVTIRGNRRST